MGRGRLSPTTWRSISISQRKLRDLRGFLEAVPLEKTYAIATRTKTAGQRWHRHRDAHEGRIRRPEERTRHVPVLWNRRRQIFVGPPLFESTLLRARRGALQRSPRVGLR